MKKLYFLLFTILFCGFSFGQAVFINEIHYDNSGADVDEGVEIAGPAGTDLSTYTITGYNGSATSGAPYSTTALSGSIPDEGSGYGAVWFAISGLQNGSPDGIALDNNGSLIQFLSYEGSFTGVGGPADAVMSTDIGVSEDGTAAAGSSLQLTGSGVTYTDFSWSGESASSHGLINTGQTFTSSPSISIISPDDSSVFPPGTTTVNVEWSTANLGGGETVDITVNGNATNSVTSPFAVATTDGQTYDITVELIDGGVVDSDMISFSTETLYQVVDIAALRTDVTTNGIGRYYEITGTSLVTHTDSYQNRKWIQDGNVSGILIYDTAGTISTVYNVGDMVSGLKGYTEYGPYGILRFIPFEDSGSIDSSGNAITPQVVTIPDFNTNYDNYESEIVEIQNVTFDDGDGVATFSTGTNYNVSDGSMNTVVMRTDYFTADYIGSIIPFTTVSSLVAVAGKFNTTAQIYVRSMSDFTLGVKDLDQNLFSVYPNPTSLSYINISSKSQSVMNVGVFDILGKQVINTKVSNNLLDVSTLTSGIYIMKISQDDASTTKKLVIK